MVSNAAVLYYTLHHRCIPKVLLANWCLVQLPAHFHVWLASLEAEFLKGKLVWVNWDVDELKARAEEIKNSLLLKVLLNGVPI